MENLGHGHFASDPPQQGSHYKTVDSGQYQPVIVFAGSTRTTANIIDQHFVRVESRDSQLDLERTRKVR